jgi:hypothetical protein
MSGIKTVYPSTLQVHLWPNVGKNDMVDNNFFWAKKPRLMTVHPQSVRYAMFSQPHLPSPVCVPSYHSPNPSCGFMPNESRTVNAHLE